MNTLLTLISGIVLEGLKTWNNERKMAFQKRHARILKRLRDAENAYYPHYSDAEVSLSIEELNVFLEAYLQGVRSETDDNPPSS